MKVTMTEDTPLGGKGTLQEVGRTTGKKLIEDKKAVLGDQRKEMLDAKPVEHAAKPSGETRSAPTKK